MRYILDTDLLSILQQNRQPECDRLTARLEEHPNEPICTTVVNFQEQALGWAAYQNQSRKPLDVLKAYRELLLIESYYRHFEILPFDSEAGPAVHQPNPISASCRRSASSRSTSRSAAF